VGAVGHYYLQRCARLGDTAVFWRLTKYHQSFLFTPTYFMRVFKTPSAVSAIPETMPENRSVRGLFRLAQFRRKVKRRTDNKW